MLSFATISMSLLALAPSHAIRVVKESNSAAWTRPEGVLKESEDEEDAPVPANNTYQDKTEGDWLDDPLYLRCGKHRGAEPVYAGANIVDLLWKDNGENCSYAARQLRSEAEERLRIEFPYICKDPDNDRFSRLGRKAGAIKLDRIIRACSPAPSPEPTREWLEDAGSDFGICGKYVGGWAAAQEAANMVDRLWRSNFENCSYATSQFSSDAESSLLDEFPDNCSTQNAIRANQAGRRSGAHHVTRVIEGCSQPVPRPTPSNDDVEAKQ